MPETDPSPPLSDPRAPDALRLERIWVNERLQEPFWPIDLCIAWALKRSEDNAAEVWLSNRFNANAPLEGWVAATASIVGDLRSGAITAEAADTRGERRALTAMEWRNLQLKRVGTIYQAHSAARVEHFRDIQLRADDVRKQFPASTAAALRLNASIACERVCEAALVKLMEADPNHPIPKLVLKQRPEFEGLPLRLYLRAFTAAAVKAKAPKWRMAGRRRRNSPHT